MWHKVVVELDEEGTVAAAVSAVECNDECELDEAEPFEMTCDRPFLFVMMKATGCSCSLARSSTGSV